MRLAELDAVTVDGFGTLVELESPIAPLVHALEERGVERSRDDVARAFAAEARHYRLHAHNARDDETLAALRRECVTVFLRELAAPLEPEEFVDAFLAALVFRPAEGAVEALAALQANGLKLAVVSNWDCSLPERLDALGLARALRRRRHLGGSGRAEAGAATRFCSRSARLEVAAEPRVARRRRGG